MWSPSDSRSTSRPPGTGSIKVRCQQSGWALDGCGSASRTSMRSSPLAKASCRRLRSGHAEQWKEVLAAAEAVSNAARLRDQVALRAAMSALSHAAEQFGSAD